MYYQLCQAWQERSQLAVVNAMEIFSVLNILSKIFVLQQFLSVKNGRIYSLLKV